MAKKEKKYLTFQEAADALGESVRLIQLLVKDGKLKTEQKGRRVLIPSEEITRFIWK